MRQRSKERIGGHLIQIRAGADGKEESGPRGPHGVDKATGALGTGGEGST